MFGCFNNPFTKKSKVIIDKKINESTDDFIELDYHMDWKNLVLSSGEEKADMIKDTGADAVTTICPFCQRNLQDGLNDINEENVKTMHILELLEKSYE